MYHKIFDGYPPRELFWKHEDNEAETRWNNYIVIKLPVKTLRWETKIFWRNEMIAWNEIDEILLRFLSKSHVNKYPTSEKKVK